MSLWQFGAGGAFDDREDTRGGAQIADRDLLEKLEAIDRLPEHDKDTLKEILDAFILKHQFQRLAGGDEVGATVS